MLSQRTKDGQVSALLYSVESDHLLKYGLINLHTADQSDLQPEQSLLFSLNIQYVPMSCLRLLSFENNHPMINHHMCMHKNHTSEIHEHFCMQDLLNRHRVPKYRTIFQSEYTKTVQEVQLLLLYYDNKRVLVQPNQQYKNLRVQNLL